MPSQLAYKAFKINQQMNDLQLTFFPIRWSSKENKWKYGKAINWQLYLFISILWKIVIVIPLISLALHQMLFRYNQLFKIQHIFVAILLLNLMIGSVIVDMVCYVYGRDMVVCCNWCYATENTWMHVLSTKTSRDGKKASENSKPKGNHNKMF